jgi:hypothetical protein
MFSFEMSGVTTDLLDTTCFGDTWKQVSPGLLDGGTITFSGLYDKTDSTGQAQMRTYNLSQTLVTSLRIYIDNTSYWTPKTTGPVSGVYVTEWKVNGEKAGMVNASFTVKVSGALELL